MLNLFIIYNIPYNHGRFMESNQFF